VRFLYGLLLWSLVPLVLLRLLWRSRRDADYRRRIGERFGFLRDRPQGPVLWVHAVSVGEVIAAGPLVRALRERFPGHALVVTTTTPTGARQLARMFAGEVRQAWLPFDLPGAARRFLRRLRPDAGVVMETEVWPNLYRACRRAGVPVVLANARLSASSARGYRRLRRLAAPALEDLAAVAARDESDAERFRAIAPRARIEIVGNLKFDFAPDAAQVSEGRGLRHLLGVARPVWIAASTHAGEDEIVLAAHERLRWARPDVALILVPRHPERFEDVARLCRERGFTTVRRSEGAGGDDATAVLLGDTMGELMRLYAAADVAFVGGSLVPTGGHNPLEPAALGLPVLTGPHRFNFEQVFAALFAAGGAVEVSDAATLEASVEWLLGDPSERERRGTAARGVVEAGRGATGRIVDLVAGRLGP